MVELKGLRELNIALSNIVKPFGIYGMTNGEDFGWIWWKNIITYTLAEFDYRTEWFTDFIKDTFDYDVKNYFTITLLHEIGHAKTFDDLTKEEDDYCNEEKEKIFAIANDETIEVTKEEEKAYQYRYWNLPDEYLATKWAVDFAKQNPDYIDNLINELMKLFQNYYEKNEVTDDE